ncbi:RNA-directed DNA polymerase, eukaryota [Tanacetum coccineum]
MESLHLSFQRVVDNGMFNGIKLSSSLSISHLFYADDAVFMGQWCDGNISTLIHVLECFYRASGLRINMSKSKILGVNVDSDKVKGVASKLGCLILKTPFTYLGSKVGGSMSRVHAWNEVIDRVKNRLSKWKMKTLSIGGLMFKWIWRFYTQNTLLWVRVVKAIHGDDGNVRGHVKSGAKSCWLDIIETGLGELVRFFCCVDSLPTRFNVSRIGIDIDSIMCAICDNGVETSRHLFFYCCMVRQIVRKITCWWDVPYVEVESYEDWYNWLVNLRISSMHKQMFEGIDVMRRLVAVMEIYGPEFMRKPTVTDIEKLYRHHEEKHGFPGMLGSLDCTDWEWFGCPLVDMACFLWCSRSNNDINVLYQSPLFNILKTGRAPKILFVANGVTYLSGYYLVDGIYLELAPLVKTIPEPADDDHKRILYK